MNSTAILLKQLPGLLRELARVRRALAAGRVTTPWKLEFFTTYSCASKCKTCLIWTRYRRDPEARKRELSADAFGRIAASIGGHLRWLAFTGGEVTEREDALEVFNAVLRGAPRARVISASSHGLDPEGVEALFGAVAAQHPDVAVLVTLSLDGLGDTYEAIRGVDGAARVEESLARLQALAKRHPNLAPSLQTTLSPANFDEADALLAHANALSDGNVVTIANDSRVLTEGKLDGIDARRHPKMAAALRSAERATGLSGFSDLFAHLYLRLLRTSLESDDAPLACAAGLASLTISPYGEVLQCDRHDQPLGRLEGPEYDLAALLRSPEFARALTPDIGCRECFTPCQAYPTIMQAPLAAVVGAARG